MFCAMGCLRTVIMISTIIIFALLNCLPELLLINCLNYIKQILFFSKKIKIQKCNVDKNNVINFYLYSKIPTVSACLKNTKNCDKHNLISKYIGYVLMYNIHRLQNFCSDCRITIHDL